MPSPTAFPRQRFVDADDNPLSLGFLYCYAAGTTNPLATYQDSAGATPNTHPIALDANGECVLWLGDSGAYDFRLTNAAGGDQPAPGLNVQSVARITSAAVTDLEARLASTASAGDGVGMVGVDFADKDLREYLADTHARTAEEIAASVTPTDYSFDVGDARRYGAVFDDSTNSQSGIAAAFSVAGGCSLKPGAVRVGTGNLAIAAKSKIAGAGRESSFLRTTHASNPVIDTTAQFVTYQDFTVDRSGSVAGTGIKHWAVSNAAPLEGLKLERMNINGHSTGLSLRDVVLGGIDESYIQAGETGLDINSTGVNNVATFFVRRSWIRGNTTIGAQLTNVLCARIEQTAFESAGGRTCPLGLRISGGSAHTLEQTWWESLTLNAEFIGCGDVHLNGGIVEGTALSTRGFYAANSSGQTTLIFDGAWKVLNLSVPFATADAGATIIVRTPSLAAYTFTAVGTGSQVIFDFDLVARVTYNPPNIVTMTTTTQSVTVTGASVGDFVDVSFSDTTTDVNLCRFTGTVTGPDTVLVLVQNLHTADVNLGSGTLLVRVRKAPIVS